MGARSLLAWPPPPAGGAAVLRWRRPCTRTRRRGWSRRHASRVVLANRATGPERVLQMAADDPRVMEPSRRGELEAVIASYRQLAGFDISQVNERYDEWQAEIK